VDILLASENKLELMVKIFMVSSEFINSKKSSNLSFVNLSKAILKWKECLM